MKYFLCLIVFFVPVALSPMGGFVRAQDSGGLIVSPQIIDEKTRARDILDYQIKISNQTGKFVQFYTFVNDLDPETGRQEFTDPASLDKSVSAASWISISRGVVELMPGEEAEIPLNIKVNLSARTGQRHAAITFARGSNRPDAEKNLLSGGQPQVIVNLEITEDIIERAQVVEFKSERNVYLEPPVKFILTIKNIGNTEITPKGFIYFYNRRGEEIDKVPVSEQDAAISPDSVLHYPVVWDRAGAKGKYRARLEVEYGRQLKRDLQDTVYFWIFPKKIIIMIGGGFFVLILIITTLIYKVMHHRPASWRDQEHKTAAGVINLKDEG